MKTFTENQISNLNLHKTDINERKYELKSGEETYASFDFNKENSICTIQTEQNTYEVEKNGIWKPFILLNSLDQKTKIQVNITPNSANTIIDGIYLQFKNIHFWKNHWAWTDGSNHTLIQYKPIIAGSIKGEISISDEYKYSPNLETICCIGCYLLIAFDIDEELNP